ncbi:MAG: hypothetical protein RR219_03715 [Clostridiales bacterium]
MNKTMFALYLKRTIKLWLLVTVILCGFLVVICAAFTPNAIADFEGVVSNMAIGNIIKSTSLEGFFANIFYAVIGMIFPMVYSSFAANKIIASQVDSGSMACWLSTPLSRYKISVTGGVYLVFSQLIMFICVFITGLLAAGYFQPGVLDIKIFAYLCLGGFLYHFAIGGLCYFSSCLCNTVGKYLILGAALPLFFIFLNVIRQLVDSLDFLKFATLNTLLNTAKILENGNFWFEFAAMAAIGMVLYILAVKIFKKKDLPL